MLAGSATERISVTARRHSHVLGGVVVTPGHPVSVPFDYVEKFGFNTDLVFDFSGFQDRMHSYVDGRPAFDFWCPLSAVDGYGRHAIDIWRGLRQLGCEVELRNSGQFVDPQFLPPEVQSARFRSSSIMPAKVGLAMSVAYDPSIWDHQSLLKIVITQFETNRIPERHVEAVNRCDHLIVTSSFQPPIWKRCGVKRPISQLTPGVDTEFFRFAERPKDGLFKVLILGALTGRKNPLGAIRIFQRASEGNPDWRLTIKTRAAKGIDRVRELARQDQRIRLLVGDSHPQQVLQFYQAHDVLLWPTLGEGVGLPPLEAMATGMELVCADHSGMSDSLDERWSWPIRTAGLEYAGPPHGFDSQYVATYGDVGQWWRPDEDHAAHQLQRAFRAWYAGKGKGRLASEFVRNNHGLRQQAESVLAVVKEYL